MGTDIYGWVEVRHTMSDGGIYWSGVISVHGLLGRNYNIFAALFGVRNDGEYYTPAFAGCGIPDSVSEETAIDIGSDVTPDATWFLWSEFEDLVQSQEIDPEPWLPASEWSRLRWDPAYEIIEARQDFLRRRRKDDSDGEVETLIARTVRQGPLAGKNYIYREVFWRLDEIITPDWQTLFDMAALLAKRFGSSSVRFVMWFV